MDNYFTIEGIASTESEDSYGEIINQKGIDLSFVQKNLVTINIEHADGFPIAEMAVIGVITDAEVTNDGLWIKGRIYNEHQYASSIYRELTKPGHSLQLSVEMDNCVYGDGRLSNIVLSGVLTAVALTKDPANADTYATLAKSITEPTLKWLANELNQLHTVINTYSQRQQRKKKIIVKVIRVA